MDRDLKKSLLKELERVYEECKLDNWDNDEGKGVKEESYNYIRDFINNIMSQKDSDFGFPTIVPFSCGSIGVEWNIKNTDIMTMLFESTGDVVYSILTNKSKMYGTMNYCYNNLNSIIDRIILVLENGE